MPITTERWVVTKCPDGHDIALVFQAAGWAVLFERGLRRVASESPRDALLDAYTAFEMYLSEVPARARYDQDPTASPKRLRMEMKHATHTAERAIGAARAIAALVSGKPAPKWDEKVTRLRNDAIHAGRYPTLSEAEEACEEIARSILEFERLLGTKLPSVLGTYHQAVWLEEGAALRQQHPHINPTFVGGGHMFDFTGRVSDASVAARIAEYRQGPDIANLIGGA